MNSQILQENNLVNTILSLEPLKEIIMKNLKKDCEVLMLIGNTGVGKSTIFNWMNGAQFQFIREGIKNILSLSDEENEKFSKQKCGMESVTTEPKFFYNEQFNHIVIDFPGFKDTRGQNQELFIKLLFQEILGQYKVKLACVITQLDENLKDRGLSIRESVQNVFQNNQVKFDSISLILNQYMGDLNEYELINDIKQQLENLRQLTQEQDQKDIYKALQQNIIVLHKVKPATIQEVLNDENRKTFWNNVCKTTPIQFIPQKLEYNEQISEYISNIIKSFIEQAKNQINAAIQYSKTIEQKENLIKEVNDQILLISNVLSKNDFGVYLKTIFNYYQQYEVSSNFLIIFNFFAIYKDQIKGYKDVFEQLNQFSNELRIVNVRVQEQIYYLYEMQSLRAELIQLKQINEEEREKNQQQQKIIEKSKEELLELKVSIIKSYFEQLTKENDQNKQIKQQELQQKEENEKQQQIIKTQLGNAKIHHQENIHQINLDKQKAYKRNRGPLSKKKISKIKQREYQEMKNKEITRYKKERRSIINQFK